MQAAIIGSGLGTWGIAGLEVIAGVGVALFFTLWDTVAAGAGRRRRRWPA